MFMSTYIMYLYITPYQTVVCWRRSPELHTSPRKVSHRPLNVLSAEADMLEAGPGVGLQVSRCQI